MNKYLKFLLWGVLLLYAAAPARADAALQEESLLKIIRDMNQRYHVHFTYDREMVENIRIKKGYDPERYNNLNDALNSVLKNTSLRYKILDMKYVIIYQDDEKGMKSLEKMIQVLQEIIDQNKVNKPAPPVGHAGMALVPENTAPAAQRLLVIVRGKVTDENGEPLAGVSIIIKGLQQGTITDAEGIYNLDVPEDKTVLVFSFVGYVSQEIETGGRKVIDLSLAADTRSLDELVVVGYGAQKKATVTGAISSMNGKPLTAAPSLNLSGSLGGRMPGLTVVSSSGEPGRDNAMLRIRGSNTLGDNSPLIVVDGIQNRDINRLNPADIENITILKDASAAIYGAQAANGVILITTKRGTTGVPELTVNFNQGWSKPTRIPEMADAATYATMINEIDAYRHNDPTFSADAIQKYRDGSDPWLYPNTDWFGEVFKPTSLQNQSNIALKGGTKVMKYFISAGYNFQDGIYKNSATKYSQADIRSNIDAKISKHIQLSLDLVGRQENRDFPVYTTNQIFSSLITGGAGSGGRPTELAWFSGQLPNSGFINGLNPVVMGTNLPGYDKGKNYSFLSNVKLIVDIPGVKGLSLVANASVDKGINYQKRWIKPFDLYSWDKKTLNAANEPVVTGAKFGPSTDPQLTQSTVETQRVLLNALLNYQFSLKEQHTFKIMAGSERITGDAMNFSAFRRGFISTAVDQLFAGSEQQRNNGGSASHSARLNYFGRVNYDFREKYLVEFVWRNDGSYIFPEKGRFGFFPGVSAGWKISEEGFWKDNINAISSLKIRGSWGKTGNDRIAPFQYLSSYGFSSTPYVLDEEVEVKALNELRIANPNVTWEVAEQSNVGIDVQAFKNKLTFSADYFHNLRTNILWFRNASVPISSGLTLPAENIGKVSNQGFEFQAEYHDNVGNLNYSIGLNGASAKNKIKFWDETPGVPEYQRSTGQPMNAGLYYNAIGIFRDQGAVDAYPHWDGAGAGDIRFEDVNKDGAIDGQDRVRSKKTDIPTLTGGLSVDLEYKNFYASVFIHGSAGAVRNAVIESGKVGNFLAEYADGRWTPENPDAKKPRTWNGNGEYWSSGINNTYWLINNNFMRLKNFQLGYNFPALVTDKLGMSQLTIYVTGLNLITLSKSKSFDPETIGNSYPLNKVYNCGLRLSFK
ncbi:SusC/RagA family TonB-linked outer membrane protein [Dyadobacter bucti]|uniref:SusC/RagA family TonB-linked outer membrane protein n=1 Tax=Dyadobacter bucti TaxID=2572203 RepID=UPI00197A8EED|nr:SusC/RagA family TonB-linked outer membrane protein [Dyadobacter bucti]